MKIDQQDAPDLTFYQDLQGLEAIKHNADQGQALESAARQFEVQFLKQVLHQMREATEVIAGDDSLLSSDSQRFYQELCDSQLALMMANQNKTGLQSQIVAQMSHLLPDGVGSDDGEADGSLRH